MPVTSPTSVARQFPGQLVHFLRKGITFADNGIAHEVGIIPAGAVILKASSGVTVQTAFNAGTSNTLNIGTTADDDLYGTLLALGTTTFVPLDEAVGFRVSAATRITATVVLTGTAATTGDAEVTISYIPDTDG